MPCILWKVICITNFTFTKCVHQTVANLQHVYAHHRCHHQGVLSVTFIIPSAKHLHTHYVCASVWPCFCSATVQRIILRVLWWVVRGMSDSGTCDVPKRVGDLLMSDEHILCMWSWLCKLKSVNVPVKILLCYPCKESGVHAHDPNFNKLWEIYFSLVPIIQQDATSKWFILHFVTIYMFRVTIPPIIRSTMAVSAASGISRLHVAQSPTAFGVLFELTVLW